MLYYWGDDDERGRVATIKPTNENNLRNKKQIEHKYLTTPKKKINIKKNNLLKKRKARKKINRNFLTIPL